MTDQPRPRIVFVGAHREAEAPLRWLASSAHADLVGVVTLTAERLAAMSAGTDLAAIATTADLHRTTSANDPATVEWMTHKRPHLLIVIGWTELLREQTLRVPLIACLGFHASLLPRYRGRAPINWALINGESETGNTLMVLSPGADEGDIVDQRVIHITDDDDCATLYAKVSETEVDMLASLIPSVLDEPIVRRPQTHDEATVMPRRRPEDGVIDWTRPTRALFNWVRALTHPYPGAFGDLEDRRVWIWRAEDAAVNQPPAMPGTVGHDDDGWPIVATGDGWLRLLVVERDGEDACEGVEAASSYLRAGVRFEQGDGA